MVFAQIINRIARVTNKWIMFVLAIVLTVLLFSLKPADNTAFITSLWTLFILLSLIYSINGILLRLGFNKEVKKLMKAGKPIQGISGFPELVDSLKSAQSQSYLITFTAILSFAIFWFRDNLKSAEGDFGSSMAIMMAFIAISITFLVDYPEDPSLTPGGLVGYYEPDSFPLVLDNLIADVFMAYLDPITAMEFDDWSIGVLKMLNPEFENDEDQQTRLERAREKILLLAYLSFSNPYAFTKEIIDKEIVEIISEDNLEKFKKGKNVGLTWKEIVDVVKRVEKRSPEPFRLIDRLMVELTDNYYSFTKLDDLYFTVGARSNQGSVTESVGLIAFFINKTQQEDRDIKVWYRTDKETIHPSYSEVNLSLDKLTDPFPEEEPPLISDGQSVDVLTLMTTLLQTGDGIWFRLQPRGFGYRVITVFAEEEAEDGDRKPTMGVSFEMKFTKSISWYIKSFAPKLSALGGIILPFIRGYLPEF